MVDHVYFSQEPGWNNYCLIITEMKTRMAKETFILHITLLDLFGCKHLPVVWSNPAKAGINVLFPSWGNRTSVNVNLCSALSHSDLQSVSHKPSGGEKKLKKDSVWMVLTTVRWAPGCVRCCWTFFTFFWVTFMPGFQSISHLPPPTATSHAPMMCIIYSHKTKKK